MLALSTTVTYDREATITACAVCAKRWRVGDRICIYTYTDGHLTFCMTHTSDEMLAARPDGKLFDTPVMAVVGDHHSLKWDELTITLVLIDWHQLHADRFARQPQPSPVR